MFGSTVRVTVTASNAGGSATATSEATAVVTVAPPTPTTVTFSVAASGDDGDLLARAFGYPPPGPPSANSAGSIFTVGRRFANTNYDVLVGLLRFDTSSIPDGATITSVKLRVYASAKTDSDDRGLVGEWYADANWPIDPTDYALSSAADALGGADLTGIVVGATNEFPLMNLGSLSKTGYTGLRLHIDGGQPSGDNFLQIVAFDHATLPEPQLVVTYTN